MRLRTLLPALLLFGLAPAGQAIDFKLREYHVNDLDGENVDLYFAHESSRVFYRPPPGWKATGSPSSFEAIPPAPGSGRLKIASMPPPADLGLPGDDGQKEAFQKLALGTLPADATAPEVLGVTVDRLGGKELPCTRVTIAYHISVQERVVTICYAAFRPNLWLRFSVDAAKVDFARASGEAFHSLEGFTEVPGEVPAADRPRFRISHSRRSI